MRNVLMIDIETTGKMPGCRVLTIGAFGFDKDGNQVEFYKRLDAAKMHDEGLADDAQTIDWWANKPKDVFAEAFGGSDDPATSIGEFKSFCYGNFRMGKDDGFQVWCNGLDFDFPILKAFFEHYGFHFPWKFWCQYDYRTINNIFPIVKAAEKNKDAHNALEDAKAQMRGLRDFFERAEKGALT